MNPKFRAWDRLRKRISVVDRIYFDTEGVQLRDDGGLYWRHFREVILMQSTGLKDKNGTEIFEGDVVHAYGEGTSLIGVVEYFDNAYCIKSKNDIYNPLWTNAEHYEVIGNIYENPELMEVEHDPKRQS